MTEQPYDYAAIKDAILGVPGGDEFLRLLQMPLGEILDRLGGEGEPPLAPQEADQQRSTETDLRVKIQRIESHIEKAIEKLSFMIYGFSGRRSHELRGARDILMTINTDLLNAKHSLAGP
jgi:hypothetical protein